MRNIKQELEAVIRRVGQPLRAAALEFDPADYDEEYMRVNAPQYAVLTPDADEHQTAQFWTAVGAMGDYVADYEAANSTQLYGKLWFADGSVAVRSTYQTDEWWQHVPTDDAPRTSDPAHLAGSVLKPYSGQ